MCENSASLRGFTCLPHLVQLRTFVFIWSICINGLALPLQFILVDRSPSTTINETHTLTAYKLINEKYKTPRFTCARLVSWYTGMDCSHMYFVRRQLGTPNAHTKVVKPINDNHFPLVLIKFEKYIQRQCARARCTSA